MRRTASQILRNLERRIARLEKKSSKVRLTENFYAILEKEYKLAMSLSELCDDDCKKLIQIVAGFNTGAVQKGTHKYSNNDTVQKIVRINQSDKQRAGRILAQACLLCTKNKNHERLILKMLKKGGRLPTTLYRRDFDSAFKAVFPSFTSVDALIDDIVSDANSYYIELEDQPDSSSDYNPSGNPDYEDYMSELEFLGSGHFSGGEGAVLINDYYTKYNDEIVEEIYEIFKNIMTPVIIKEVEDFKEGIEETIFETDDFKSHYYSSPLEEASISVMEWDYSELLEEQQRLTVEFKFVFTNSVEKQNSY